MRSRLCSSTRWRYRRGRGIERIDGHYVSTHPAAICTQRKRTCSPTPCPAWATGPGIYHYAPKEHALERRSLINPSTWSRLLEPFPRGAMLIGLTSIPWRESWKYGERAYRYCQHDAGHAVAALRIAAAILGLLPRVLDQQIKSCLVWIVPTHGTPESPNFPMLLPSSCPRTTTSKQKAISHLTMRLRLPNPHNGWGMQTVSARSTMRGLSLLKWSGPVENPWAGQSDGVVYRLPKFETSNKQPIASPPHRLYASGAAPWRWMGRRAFP